MALSTGRRTITALETDESRLGRLEGQVGELSLATQDLRQEVRQHRQETREDLRALSARIDRLLLAMLAGAAGIMAALVVLAIRAE